MHTHTISTNFIQYPHIFLFPPNYIPAHPKPALTFDLPSYPETPSESRRHKPYPRCEFEPTRNPPLTNTPHTPAPCLPSNLWLPQPSPGGRKENFISRILNQTTRRSELTGIWMCVGYAENVLQTFDTHCLKIKWSRRLNDEKRFNMRDPISTRWCVSNKFPDSAICFCGFFLWVSIGFWWWWVMEWSDGIVGWFLIKIHRVVSS